MGVEDLDPEKVTPDTKNLKNIIKEIVSWAEENPSRATIENVWWSWGLRMKEQVCTQI